MLPLPAARLIWIALVSILFAAAASPGAQSSESAEQDLPPDIFMDVIEVRVVNIEVVVVDSDGNRVTGLGPDDFRLLVDGEEVSIDYFSEIFGGTAVKPETERPAVETVPTLRAGDPVPTSYLLFIDDYFSISRDRNRVLRHLEEDVVRLGPEDRLAIVAWDGRDLTMLTSWTSSMEELEDALRQARSRDAYGLQRISELRMNDRDRRFFDSNRVRAPRTRLEGFELDYARRLASQVEQSVHAAVATLRAIASPPGRKVMLLLSGGWPWSPAEFTVNDPRSDIEDLIAGAMEMGVPGRERLFRPLSDTANLLGYTLYPVDVPGYNREQLGDPLVSAARPLAPGAGFGPLNREQAQHFSLSFLAEETGGRALLNGQRESAFEVAADDTRSYYWLGFTPQRQEDDTRHDIEVEVKRPGLRARSREGFVDLSRRSEVTMMVESSLLFGHPAGSLPLDLRFGKPEKAGRGKIELPVRVGIPASAVAMVPVEGGFAARLEVRVSVVDEEGNRSETPVQSFVARGERQPEPGQIFWYGITLKMRNRPHRLAVAVYDPVTGNILSTTGEVSP